MHAANKKNAEAQDQGQTDLSTIITNKKQLNMKHLLLTLALIVIPAICTAGRWVKIDSQNGSTFYIHTDIKTENGNYLVWIKTTYDSEEARQDVKKQYNTQKSICEHQNLYCYDSTWNKLCVKEIQAFDAEGKQVDSYTSDKYEWVYVAPESAGEVWGQAARFIIEHPDKVPAQ